MNTDTKRHIDSARQVLVGVVPNPTSQIDQITNALIYKFMDDMDQASIKQGGEPTFFVDDLEKYAWTRLMDPRMGNQERMNLYSEALIKFSQAKQLPELFRGIFKSAFLPYRSPETLGLFLKEIDYFDYSHPEELGNAYEYLLSIMSSQGDAGQFRTPRHIIDFIVDVVNPTKDDKVLDPACGTGGFLVSSYKHILEQHDGNNDPENKGKPLTPDERKKLMTNFEGYDIDPTMARIAQVNMYLHQFKNPKIYQYDTLSSEERWNDKFDVILANPPFMSPKGGIKPHSKFSIPSSRSEVLFVDYIMNHLRPKGRAGIIIPEGIIFQSGKAYKELRKNLVNDGLFAVVSLPAGVFNPYSGVKTSILFFDNEVAKETTDLLFIKVASDGYDLGAQRRKTEKDDLPGARMTLNVFRNYVCNGQSQEVIKSFIDEKVECSVVSKEKIAENNDYNLSADKYKSTKFNTTQKYEFFNLKDVAKIDWGNTNLTKSSYQDNGEYLAVSATGGDGRISHYEHEVGVTVLSAIGANCGKVFFPKERFTAIKNTITFTPDTTKILPKYLYVIMQKNSLPRRGGGQPFMTKGDVEEYVIPLPPLEIQKGIVDQIEVKQKVLDASRAVVENWKPEFDINDKWKHVKLSEIAEYFIGLTYSPEDVSDVGTIVLRSSNIQNGVLDFSDIVRVTKKIKENLYVKDNDILMCSRNGSKKLVGKTALIKGLTEKMTFGTFMTIIRSEHSKYLSYFFNTDYFRNQINESETSSINQITKYMLDSIVVPLPPSDVEDQIIERIEKEKEIVEANKIMIELATKRIEEIIESI